MDRPASRRDNGAMTDLLVKAKSYLDELTVLVERSPGAGAVDGETAGTKLAHQVKSLIGVSVEVRVVQTGGIERSVGKAKRVVDKRPK